VAIGPNPNPNLTRRSLPSPRCATWPLALTLTLPNPPLPAIAKVCHVAIARLEKSRKTTHSVRDVEATQGMLQVREVS
jgi:hypothetical protein